MTDGVVVRDARVRMRDGVELAADVLVPDEGGPHPALVIRGPYSRAMVRQTMDAVALARTGWAVVVQDCRGCFDSDGDFTPFHQERPDGADTIAWAADQPWCDGRVATQGLSYLGITQWLAALERPPALRAMAPGIVASDIRDGWMWEGGAFQLGFVAPWAMSVTPSAGADPSVVREVRESTRDWDDFLRIPPAVNRVSEVLPAFRHWLDPADEAYWAPLSAAASYSDLDLPVFQVAGWYDVFAEGSLRAHAGMRQQASSAYARRSQRLVVGPWAHTGLYLNASAEFNYGPAAYALAEDLPGQVTRWLRSALDGDEVEGGARVYVMAGWNDGEWRELDEWPPRSTPAVWYLDSRRGANGVQGDGRLVTRPSETAGTDRFLYDPDRPVPTRGGRTLGPTFPLSGPIDQRPVEEREDVLVYTSEMLRDDLVIMGAVTADISFATTGTSADVTVKLCDVHPDGRSFNVVDSIRRVSFAPGRAQTVRVDVGSVAQRFKAGHRVRVQVGSSNFPRFDRNASDGRGTAEATSYRPAIQTVHLGGRLASSVTLPVVAGPNREER